MISLGRKLMRTATLAAFVVLLAPAQVLAADADAPQPPFDVQGLTHHKVWVPWLFAFLFAALCVLVAFKNPHRTHLD